MAALAQDGDSLRADEPSAADDDDLHAFDLRCRSRENPNGSG
jgi:hypothetical protein